jgi:hypothetical protein
MTALLADSLRLRLRLLEASVLLGGEGEVDAAAAFFDGGVEGLAAGEVREGAAALGDLAHGSLGVSGAVGADGADGGLQVGFEELDDPAVAREEVHVNAVCGHGGIIGEYKANTFPSAEFPGSRRYGVPR